MSPADGTRAAHRGSGRSETALIRKQSGATQMYHGRKLTAHFLGPDLLAMVDGVELGGFYLTAEDARKAGRRHVDAQIKEEQREKQR